MRKTPLSPNNDDMNDGAKFRYSEVLHEIKLRRKQTEKIVSGEKTGFKLKKKITGVHFPWKIY